MKNRHRVTKWIMVMTIFFILAVFSNNLVTVALGSPNVNVIANSACKEVGVVKSTSKGKNGVPIIVMEEIHSSRAGQIQHAIALVRLYAKFGLKDIALEGYLIDDTKIDADWYHKAVRKDTRAKIEVAVRLLKEGEISSAEFLVLVYEDVSLHPIEISKNYNVELGEKVQDIPILCLFKIAQRSLTQKHLFKVRRLNNEIKGLKGDRREEKLKEYLNYILSADPWAKQTADLILSEDFMTKVSLQRHVEIMEEIKRRTEINSVKLTSEEKDALNEYIGFFRGRANADVTMVDATIKIADKKNVAVVAMIIGYAHTQQICEFLKEKKRPYAVITPNSLKKDDKTGDLDYEMYERKYQKQSVFKDGFLSNVLQRTFQVSADKKPPPVINESWFKAKSELYLFTDRIVRTVFGGGGQDPPLPPERILAAFDDNDDDKYKGQYVVIKPKKIELVAADGKDSKKGEAVLIPVILISKNRSMETEIWIKAMPRKNLDKNIPADSQDHEFVESLLKKALEEVQSEEKPSHSVENQTGKIEITLDTLLCMSEDEKQVRMMNLSTK